MRTRVFAIAIISCFSLIAAYGKESDSARSGHLPSTRSKNVHHSSYVHDSEHETDDSSTTARSGKGRRAHAGNTKSKHHSDAGSAKERKRDHKSDRHTKRKTEDEAPILDVIVPVDLPSHENENLEDGAETETEEDDSASGNLIPMEEQNGGGGP